MIEILQGGLYTTVQDYPGRVGYWNVGVPPSGPMDALAFRVANRLVGNRDGAAGLEITAMGPSLRFTSDTTVAFTGAVFQASLNGEPLPWWEPVRVRAGDVITVGMVGGSGWRCYLAVRGGIDVPEYLGSRSTFAYGGFGGFEGRPLKAGDIVRLVPCPEPTAPPVRLSTLKEVLRRLVPQYPKEWEIGAIPGPHEAPDFFTPAYAELFYQTAWRVHYNSNRLGYRLEGPRPEFSRPDGGEGGRHPSNILDCAYAIGTVNFTGDMPVIITADGPSLGGFVSLATIPTAELWKVGQARPHDFIRFRRMKLEEAREALVRQERLFECLRG